MRSFYALSAAMLALLISALTACSPGNRTANNANQANTNARASASASATPAGTHSSEQPHVPHPEARRISVAELQAALARNEAVVVDVRSETQFQDGHIRGALLIPAGQVAGRAAELPRDKMIVTYCS